MSIDVNKLIADTKEAQAQARTAAEAAAKETAKNKAEAEVKALSKKQLEYADSLKPTLARFEDELRMFATKIARGDKLSAIEQKDFNKLQADYKSVSKTVDTAIKKANDILVEARRGKSSGDTGAVGDASKIGPDSSGYVIDSVTGKRANGAYKTKTGGTMYFKDGVSVNADGTPFKPARNPDGTIKVTPTSKTSTAVDKNPVPGVNEKTSSQNKIITSGIKDRITGKEEKPLPTKVVTKLTADEIFAKAASEFGAIDTIFKSNPELSELMTRAVNEKWKPARWASELQNTNWFKSNATSLQQRGFYKRQYNDLINSIPAGAADRQAQIDQLGSTTEYGRGLASVKRLIQAEAIAEGAVIEDAALNTLAQDIFDNALEKDGLAIKNYVKAQIKYQPGKILSGKAGTDLADLKKTAVANGLDLDKAFGTSIQGWLQKLASGESVETYKGIIRQAAKAGLPERVASLLDNGVDLETIYTPYKNILANTLEINPNSITLNDPTLRSAIGPDKEMSLYDYQRLLRKDSRWQYTNNAMAETSDAVMKVLKDFGFQG